MEKEIEELSKAKVTYANQLSQSELSYEDLQKIATDLEKTVQLLDQKELRWLELSEKFN